MAAKRSRAAILMDAAKRKEKLPSDYALAKLVKVNPTKMGAEVRNGVRKMPLHAAIKLAVILRKDPVTVIAQLELEREKDRETRRFWRDYIKVRSSVKGPHTEIKDTDALPVHEQMARMLEFLATLKGKK